MTADNGVITRPKGFRTAAVHCGIKSDPDKPDLALLVADRPAVAVGLFTSNPICSPAVRVAREHTRRGTLRGVVVNAGNANACTGQQGRADARRMAELAADAIDCAPEDFAVASTGVIGHPLPMDKIQQGIEAARQRLSDDATAATEFARAICTTDRWQKEALRTVTIDSRSVTVAGVAKGAGMISPNMATMLAFVTTDANLDVDLLRELTTTAVQQSFNRTTVDGDTSTNDTVLVLASGLADNEPLQPGSSKTAALADALNEVCLDLATSMARDGEGATKLVTVHVTGALNDEQAERAARHICNSSLVKTAMFGCDPNWGRIIVAAGSARIQMDETRTTLRIGNEVIFHAGVPHPPTPQILQHMKTRSIDLELDLGLGAGSAVMYTCDLGHDYVTLNAEYHT